MTGEATEKPKSLDYAVGCLTEKDEVYVLVVNGARFSGSESIGTVFGFYNSQNALADAAARLDQELIAGAVWVSLNPVSLDAVHARTKRTYELNKPYRFQKEQDSLPTNEDVTSRRRILIDFDPKRASGDPKDPSTDSEHAIAVERARACLGWLQNEFDLPTDSTIYASSGNGAHVVIACDLPADEAADRLVEKFLASIADKFSDESVKVDVACKDRVRKIKIHGTLARKGTPTADRPHRRSDIYHAAMCLETCPREILEAVAATYNGQSDTGKKGGSSRKIPAAIPAGQRNSTLTSIAGRMRRQGHDPAPILAALRVVNETRCNPPLPDDELARIAEGMERYSPAEEGGRPVIRLEPGAIHDVVDHLEQALAEHDPELFQRGGLIVRPRRSLAETLILQTAKCPPGSIFIARVERPSIAERATRIAKFERYDKRSMEWQATDCPDRVALTLESRGEWPRIRQLFGVVEAPTLRPDGSVLDVPGYDPSTGLLYDPGHVEFPPIPSEPGIDDARAALSVLLDLIVGFPFVEGSDRAAAIACILTAIVRRSLPTAPLFAFRAPVMRTGKSLLVDVASMIAHGRPASVLTQAQDETEEKKRLFALLLDGVPVISFDNCERPLGGATLSAVLTQLAIRDRILGSTRQATAPTAATFMATGNNLQIIGDLVVRVVVCDLDPRVERPEERVFDRDLYEYVPEHRPELVVAGLTVLRAFDAAGRPSQGLPAWGGFDVWSSWVRSALVWLGMDDPAAGRKRIIDTDSLTQNLGALLAAWHAEIGECGITSADAIAKAKATKDTSLHDAIAAVAARKGEISSRSLGDYLRKCERRIVGGLRFERADKKQHLVVWRVVQC